MLERIEETPSVAVVSQDAATPRARGWSPRAEPERRL